MDNQTIITDEETTASTNEGVSIKHELSDKEIDSIVETAESCMPKDAVDIRDINVDVDPDAELEAELSKALDDNAELTDSEKGVIEKTSKENFDLDDMQTLQFVSAISAYKQDRTYPLYKNLPDPVKEYINKMAIQNGLPMSAINSITREIADQFINDATVEGAMIDIEENIDKMLNIPSISDLYSEHISKVMDEIIPETIDEIRREDGAKAETLEKVRDGFHAAYDFSRAKAAYKENARLRKAIRKHESELDRELRLFNYRNERTNFKMIDVTQLPAALYEVLIAEPARIDKVHKENGSNTPEMYKKLLDHNITTDDIDKLCILVTKHCENLNPEDVVDASYMYYITKNLLVLKYSQEAKTDFAAELINNICDTIAFINSEEAEFNASNLDKSKSRKKLHSK